MKRVLSIAIVVILLSGSITYAKTESYYQGDEYGESIDELFMRQDDADDSRVPILDLSHTGSQVIEEIACNTSISARRKAVVIKGMELLRFTKYNLGSKANNDRLTKPAYLDCSGFVQWAILRATGYDIGHGTAVQYSGSRAITEEELQVGDLGFKKPGGVQNLGGGNHVGIFVGYDKDGNKLWLHCTSGTQNGVNITKHSGLVYYVRPDCYEN